VASAEQSTGLVVGTLFLGLGASVFWPLTQHLITMAHEGTHAMFGSLTGGRVKEVTMSPDGSGRTLVAGGSVFLWRLVGYVGPSLFGLVAATMLVHRAAPELVLWSSIALMVVIALQIRNLFGWVAVTVAGLLFYLVIHYGSATGRLVFAYTWTWFLLLGGFLHTAQTNMKYTGWSGDGALLRGMTGLPKGFWGLLWWLATLAALVYGGAVLFGAIAAPFSQG
jgi:hypothetical protein